MFNWNFGTITFRFSWRNFQIVRFRFDLLCRAADKELDEKNPTSLKSSHDIA